MCASYLQTSDAAALEAAYRAAVLPVVIPRPNIRPTEPVPIVRASHDKGERRVELVRWGLIPGWARDVKIGSRMINARSESAAVKPGFRGAMRYRRCLVPADGFYEWRWLDEKGRRKQPYVIRMADESPFAFAGLWETWQDAAGNEIDSCTILTTEANEAVRPIHDRMPVILHREDYGRWLDPRVQDPAAVTPLLRPLEAELTLVEPMGAPPEGPGARGSATRPVADQPSLWDPPRDPASR